MECEDMWTVHLCFFCSTAKQRRAKGSLYHLHLEMQCHPSKRALLLWVFKNDLMTSNSVPAKPFTTILLLQCIVSVMFFSTPRNWSHMNVSAIPGTSLSPKRSRTLPSPLGMTWSTQCYMFGTTGTSHNQCHICLDHFTVLISSSFDTIPISVQRLQKMASALSSAVFRKRATKKPFRSFAKQKDQIMTKSWRKNEADRLDLIIWI